MNAADEIVGYEQRLLVTAAGCSIYDAAPQVRKLGGVIYPAHVDRDSYSVISNLGLSRRILTFTRLKYPAAQLRKKRSRAFRILLLTAL